MVANALLAATLVMAAILFGPMDVGAYLGLHRRALLHQYGLAMEACSRREAEFLTRRAD
jgi:hypothetical protein